MQMIFNGGTGNEVLEKSTNTYTGIAQNKARCRGNTDIILVFISRAKSSFAMPNSSKLNVMKIASGI